jgi:hypothetical protein
MSSSIKTDITPIITKYNTTTPLLRELIEKYKTTNDEKILFFIKDILKESFVHILTHKEIFRGINIGQSELRFKNQNLDVNINYNNETVNIENDGDRYDILNNIFNSNRNNPINNNTGILGVPLSYIKDGKVVDIMLSNTNNISRKFTIEGFIRYNTRYIRWIEWTVHVQRLIRLLMRNQLETANDPIVSDMAVLSDNFTEYRSDNKGYSLSDFE